MKSNRLRSALMLLFVLAALSFTAHRIYTHVTAPLLGPKVIDEVMANIEVRYPPVKALFNADAVNIADNIPSVANDFRQVGYIFPLEARTYYQWWLSEQTQDTPDENEPVQATVLDDFKWMSEAGKACNANALFVHGASRYVTLPLPENFADQLKPLPEAVKQVKDSGVKLLLSKFDTTHLYFRESFTKNWPEELRLGAGTDVNNWLQVFRDGKTRNEAGQGLNQTCLNHPDLRTYHKYLAKIDIESGMDGILLDNPGVDSQGCFCEHCMTKFRKFLAEMQDDPGDLSIAEWRRIATKQTDDYRQFRIFTIIDYVQSMQSYIRTVKPGAILALRVNYSSPSSLYTTVNFNGVSIYDIMPHADLLVCAVRPMIDFSTQKDLSRNNGVLLQQAKALARGKPVIVTPGFNLKNSDMVAPAMLFRKSVAESAAFGLPTLCFFVAEDEKQFFHLRQLKSALAFLQDHQSDYAGVKPMEDVFVFLPVRRFANSFFCNPVYYAEQLLAKNIPFRFICEDELSNELSKIREPNKITLLIESRNVLTPAELAIANNYESRGGQVIYVEKLKDLNPAQRAPMAPILKDMKSSIEVVGNDAVRALPKIGDNKIVVCLYNTAVERSKKIETSAVATPASNFTVRVRSEGASWKKLTLDSPDTETTKGEIPFTVTSDGMVEFIIPNLVISALAVLESN